MWGKRARRVQDSSETVPTFQCVIQHCRGLSYENARGKPPSVELGFTSICRSSPKGRKRNGKQYHQSDGWPGLCLDAARTQTSHKCPEPQEAFSTYFPTRRRYYVLQREGKKKMPRRHPNPAAECPLLMASSTSGSPVWYPSKLTHLLRETCMLHS